jgi:hypothetical protein
MTMSTLPVADGTGVVATARREEWKDDGVTRRTIGVRISI